MTSTWEQVTGIAEPSWFVVTVITEGKAKFQLEVTECKDAIVFIPVHRTS